MTGRRHSEKPDHEWGGRHEEHALLCHLRDENGKKARELGLNGVKARTTAGELLVAAEPESPAKTHTVAAELAVEPSELATLRPFCHEF